MRITNDQIDGAIQFYTAQEIPGTMERLNYALDLRAARQRIAALQADNDRLRAALQTVWPLYKNDCNCRKCETARAALSPPKSPEGVTERPVPEPPLPPPNISATTGKPWKKAWEKTFEAPAPVGLTLEEQREAVRLLERVTGPRRRNGRDADDVIAVMEFLSRPTVAAMLKEGA